VISIPCASFCFFVGSFLLPPVLSIAMSAFLSSAGAVLAVYWSAPKPHRATLIAWTAAFVTASQTLLLAFYSRDSLLNIVAPAIALAALLLRLSTDCRSLMLTRIRLVGGIVLALYPVFVIALFLDWPGVQDELPEDLLAATGGHRALIARFYSYPLHNFIDSESIWRIDANPEALEGVAAKLGMSSSNQAPDPFWEMPPYYWPSSLPEGARLYSTPSFPAESNRPAGSHYFMLIDVRRSRGYVWVKYNFG
jgi:hypothetical protein